jgi:hypothetical protein
MTGFQLLETLSLLTKCENAISHLSLQTPYGLVIDVAADGAVDVRLSDKGSISASDSDSKQAKPGYRYFVWPDYQTTFMWYDSDWAGNPQNGHVAVEEDELRGRYSVPWFTAYDAWVTKYTRAFEAQECQLGSGREPFVDRKEKLAWELEGMLLATWLSLQPGVDAVEFQHDSDGQRKYWLEGKEAAGTLGRFLKETRDSQMD